MSFSRFTEEQIEEIFALGNERSDSGRLPDEWEWIFDHFVTAEVSCFADYQEIADSEEDEESLSDDAIESLPMYYIYSLSRNREDEVECRYFIDARLESGQHSDREFAAGPFRSVEEVIVFLFSQPRSNQLVFIDDVSVDEKWERLFYAYIASKSK